MSLGQLLSCDFHMNNLLTEYLGQDIGTLQ